MLYVTKSLKHCVFYSVIVLFFSVSAFSQETSLGAEALCRQGIEYYNKGLSRLAAEYFRRCLEQDPANQQAKKYLGIIGQAYINTEVETARQRYEVARDVANVYGPGGLTPSRAAPSSSRNLDYRKAEHPFTVSPQPPLANQQVSQSTAQAAQQDFANRYNIREEAIKEARRDYLLEKQKKEKLKRAKQVRERREKINKALEDARFKLDFEYMLIWDGKQEFTVINSDGSRLSKLQYPIDEGGIGMVNAEVKLMPRLFFGGRYANSNFKKTTSSDEDWNFISGGTFYNYQLTEQDTKNKAQFFDVNLYYRMFDWDKDRLDDYIKNMFLVDRLYLDIFGGYQQYNARHVTLDPTTKWIVQDAAGLWWRSTATPINDGLNSIFEVEYKGPRMGLRLGGSFTEKLSSSISLSYAWLKTKSHGCWNLRNFNWWHKGKGYGDAFNVDLEALYHITPNWFIGAGYHYMYLHQNDLLYSGVLYGGQFNDLNAIRDEQMYIYGPSFKFGCRF